MSRYYEDYWNHEEELEDFDYKWPVISKLIPKNENISILDFGCGKGKITSEIIKINPFSKITGVDVSQKALVFARKKIKNVKFVKIYDGEKLPFKDNSFNFIIASDVLEHVYDTKNTFTQLHRVLKHHGKILISVPYNGIIKNLIITSFFFEYIFSPYSPHIRFYTKKSLNLCLKNACLKTLKTGYYGRFYPISRGMYVLAQK